MLLNGYYGDYDNIVNSDLDKFIQGVGMLKVVPVITRLVIILLLQLTLKHN